MSWVIQKINTHSGEVTMEHKSGETLSLVIPEEHKHDHAKIRLHIQSLTDAHIFKEKPKTEEKGHPYLLWGLTALYFGAIISVLILILRFKP